MNTPGGSVKQRACFAEVQVNEMETNEFKGILQRIEHLRLMRKKMSLKMSVVLWILVGVYCLNIGTALGKGDKFEFVVWTVAALAMGGFIHYERRVEKLHDEDLQIDWAMWHILATLEEQAEGDTYVSRRLLQELLRGAYEARKAQRK